MDGEAGRLASTASADVSDMTLVRQVVEGSQTGLAALYDRHAAAVFAVALRRFRDRDIAEEVVQETFLVLWNRAELFDGSIGSLGAWLHAIARNRGIDRVRAAGRRVPAVPFSSLLGDGSDDASSLEWLVESGDPVGVAPKEPGPEMALAAGETRAAVIAALDTLGGPERKAILLAYREGLSQSEIATRLGWPLGTVKTRTRRALRHLRDALEQSPAYS